MFDIVNDLNRQANRICDELIKAKRAARESEGAAAAYQKGRAEELVKWLESVEALIDKLQENRESRKNGRIS